MAKYTTIKELAKAFKSGELDDSYSIMIDKGGCSLSLNQDGDEDGDDERYYKCKELFQREYGDPTSELLEMAGIPSFDA